MQQIVYRTDPGKRGYWKRNGVKCRICERVMRAGECIIKWSADVASCVHRDCLENWLAKTPIEGDHSRAALSEQATTKEFNRIRRKLMREAKAG